jgi:hypothetical protein
VLREVSQRVAATEEPTVAQVPDEAIVDSVVAAAKVPDVVPEDLAVKIGLVSAA